MLVFEPLNWVSRKYGEENVSVSSETARPAPAGFGIESQKRIGDCGQMSRHNLLWCDRGRGLIRPGTEAEHSLQAVKDFILAMNLRASV